jgi:protein-S-isoprenylcysteine O-methyltransferase Ste14
MNRWAVFFLVFVTVGLSILLFILGWITAKINLLGWFLMVTGFVYFFGMISVYWIRRIKFWQPRSDGKLLREERDDWSFWFIVVGMVAVFYLPPVEYLLWPAILPRLVSMEIMGLFIIISGSVLFVWARRTLGNFYSGHVSLVEGQQLVQSGPYRFIRHPAYAGYILIALGLFLGYSSIAGVAALLFLLLPSIIYRLRVEDKLLAEHFGADFDEYAARVARLIPGMW